MTNQQLNNLVAFTKLYGYIRYFHPSTEAQKIDWDKFAIYGMEKVEGANDSDELKNILNSLFLPIAPTLKIFNKSDNTQEEFKEYSPKTLDNIKEVVWKHHGFMESENSHIYYKYIGENKPDSVFKNLPVTDRIFRSEIGVGLSVVMPIVLYSDSIGTLPRGDTSKIKDLIKRDHSQDYNSSNINRYVRFADIAITWNVMQHFDTFLDVIKTDWQAELPIAFKRATNDTSDIDFLCTLKRFTAKLNDGHVGVQYSKSDGNDFYPGFRWEVVENQLVITETLEEIKDKLKPGDIILEIDGLNALAKLASYDSIVSGATIEWKRVDNSYRKGSLEMLVSGKENSIMKLKVLHIDKTINSVEIARNHNGYLNEKKLNKIFEILNGIYYIDMTRCTLEDYDLIRHKLIHSKGIIYDCRGFPKMFGIYLSDMSKRDMIVAFNMSTPLILYPDRNKITYDVFPNDTILGSDDYLRARKVVITNSRAISGAESLLMTIQYYELATIVGEHTAGTDGIMNGFILPGGYKVVFTGEKFLNYDGSQFNGIGVIPDVLTSKSVEGVSKGKDELLEKAIEVVSK